MWMIKEAMKTARPVQAKWGAVMRRRRARHVLRLVRSIYEQHGRCRIIDLGGEPDYWALFDRAELRALGVTIVMVNPQAIVVSDPMFTSIQGDARHLPDFADHSFDLVHSNSVIEHVGGWHDKEAFSREVRRLAPAYFVQTPYQWFPIEPHWLAPFVHWFSEHARAKWLMMTRKALRGDYARAMRVVEGARLLDRTQMSCLFSDARLVNERILGLTKSVMAIRTPE